MKNTFKRLHKWPGLIIAFILLYFGITGIIMNHRALFSGIDVPRTLIPDNYAYRNWNNAALKGNLVIGRDRILLYGNIGVWLTDSTYSHYSSFNTGFPEGSDNLKIFDLQKDNQGNLYAATLFGLYAYNSMEGKWEKFQLQLANERFVGMEYLNDTLYAINRSYLFKGKAAGTDTKFIPIELPAPEGYQNKVSLFATMWQIHSGEIFGIPGKIYMDLLGLVTTFLSVTGIVYFFFPQLIKRRKNKSKPVVKLAAINRWSLRWHNSVGAWTFILLVILFLTGMFLRPPLLIAIANAKLKPVKCSHLDQPNPWYDKLRDILFDKDRDVLLFSTSEGMYASSLNLSEIKKLNNQPPVSVMGINVFQPFTQGSFLVGSFSGIFVWNPDYPEIYNYATGQLYTEQTSGRPIGDLKITGVLNVTDNSCILVDYDRGTIPNPNKKLPVMPHEIQMESKMSLWNLSLEIHTGRIFQSILGDFYILLVPLAGLTGTIVVISGYMLWRRKYRKT